MEHWRYLVPGDVFYDRPEAVPIEEASLFRPQLVLPHAWTTVDDGYWRTYSEDGSDLPEQGWKIHVAARRADVQVALDRAGRVAVDAGVTFKHLSSARAYAQQNSKTAARFASGKLMTLYSRDEGELFELLDELVVALRDIQGPYVLSDTRWHLSSLYLRYGAFRPRLIATSQGLQPAMLDGLGRFVHDDRSRFQVPPWLDVSDRLRAGIEESRRHSVDDFPFSDLHVLHFSNGGGVYRATNSTTGAHVVLKEGRPYAGLDAAGADAYERVDREGGTLLSLADIACVPRLLSTFTAFEHRFIELQLIEGLTLAAWRGNSFPLVRPGSTPRSLRAYADAVEASVAGVRSALADLHAAGWAYSDLHSRNVMLREPDSEVRFVDFEAAHRLDAPSPTGLAHPAYQFDEGMSGAERDLASLDMLRLGMFAPAAEVSALTSAEMDRLIDWACDAFTLTRSYFGSLGRVPLRPTPASPSRRRLLDCVGASAQLTRADRLFPGDPLQFEHAIGSLAHGAGGVLWALRQLGETHQLALERLGPLVLDQLEQRPRLGLYDGLAGSALALTTLGQVAAADLVTAELLDRLNTEGEYIGSDLGSGLAGIACYLADLVAAGRDEAGTWLERSICAMGQVTRAGSLTTPALMSGWSGITLASVHSYDCTGDESLLNLAEGALERALSSLVPDQGLLNVVDGTRTLPYLATGNAGVALALRELVLRGRADARRLSALLRPCAIEYVVQPQLFNGRAGLAATLALCQGLGQGDWEEPAIQTHVEALASEAVEWNGTASYRGEQLHRLSMDLATGSAGVLLALGVVDDPSLTPIPYVSPRENAPEIVTATRPDAEVIRDQADVVA